MLPSRSPAGAAASRAGARRCARRAQPESSGRPDVAGTQRRLVLPHTPRRPAAGVAGVAANAGPLPQRLPSWAALYPRLPRIHTPRGTINRATAAAVASLLSGITPHTHIRTPGRAGGREGGRGGRPAVSQRFGAQSGPCHRNPSANPKIPSPRRGGTRGGNVIAGSNRKEDLGFFVCVCVCGFSIRGESRGCCQGSFEGGKRKGSNWPRVDCNPPSVLFTLRPAG